jgi:hypothetical protein
MRVNAGRQYAISDVRQAVLAQYAGHKSWSVQLVNGLTEQAPDVL